MSQGEGSSAEDTIKFSNIENTSNNGTTGVFKCTNEKLGWKDSSVTGATNTVALAGAQISEAFSWPVGKGSFALEMRLQDARIMRFSGFKPGDLASLKQHFEKCYKVDVVEKKVASSGHNWGEWLLHDEEFTFMVEDKLGFDIRASDISQVVASGKSDLSLTLNDDGDDGMECVNEIRFAILPRIGDPEVIANDLKEELLQKAGLSASGDAVASLQDLQIIAPRGRYDIEFSKKIMKLHGKTHSYTVKYSNITRLFCVPKPDKLHVELVIGLDQPVRQGQQTHLWLCVLMSKEKEVTVAINADPEDLGHWKLSATETGPQYDVVTRLIKNLTSKPVTIPASEYQSDNGFNCMTCNHKGAYGCLFPLKKSFLFVDKPVVWTPYDQVETVYFQSSIMRGKSFDFIIKTKIGQALEFTNIQRDDYQPLFEYLKKVGIKIENLREVQKTLETSSQARAARGPASLGPQRLNAAHAISAAKETSQDDENADDDDDDDEEDEDEDFESEGSEDDDSEDGGFVPEEPIAPDDDDGPPAKRARRRT